ncbi:acyl carrier protein [Paracoccus sp. Z118]|uniref:phosphopantetheine-binding protein n=1 Tax=Paracoccus sp. Z118 TaxID=2851017 RepID=UPI001C2C15BA|nr:phosphopantetheine-binding protein [Paracoccus sp. Z118]MBV0891396.1 acyl carrier protein [Paracoccus sp. Z118]
MKQDDLLSFLRRTSGDETVGPDTPLFSTGLIDSVAMMDVIGYIETHGGIQMGTEDVTLENLDTAARMQTLVAARR